MQTQPTPVTAAVTAAVPAFIRSKTSAAVPLAVVLIARTGGRKTVRVRETGVPTPRTFGVYAFDLVDRRGARLDPALIAALPWAGKGDDPLDPEGRRVALYNMPHGEPPAPVQP